ncbi:MAG: hypothetical protein AAGE01_14485 [Pseudomonadota bacterium]
MSDHSRTFESEFIPPRPGARWHGGLRLAARRRLLRRELNRSLRRLGWPAG